MPTAPAPRRTDPHLVAHMDAAGMDVGRVRASRPAQLLDVLRRLLAAAVLTGVLVGIPIAIARLADGVVPRWASIRSAWTTGRIDDDALVQIGALLFTSLWLWFGATAVAEATHVLRARSRAAGRPVVLEPVSRTPSGGVRRLVRLALISSTALIGTSFAPLVARGGGEARAAGAEAWRQGPRIEVTVDDPVTTHRVDRDRFADAPPVGVAHGGDRIELARPRDTPYSIAARLGDAAMRDRIIQLNHGSIAADGSRWTGGVFPAGTAVLVPETRRGPSDATDASATTGIRWVPHRVEPGESIFAIAAELARDDDRSVGEVADEIIQRNLGRTMAGGGIPARPSRSSRR